MSEQITFDRAKGFVALPVEVLEIDMTPGAFRLLAELCRMANIDGYCWPSLDQLSDRMGRSKSAISGYIKELREAALVDTETQKTANGYNYRLKYRVTFWADWRASLRGAVTQKAERSVQPVERLEESKNHIHKNQSPPLADDVLDDLLKVWGRCFHGAPYPAAATFPAEDTVLRTDVVLGNASSETIITADIQQALRSLWARKAVEIPAQAVAVQAEVIAKTRPTPAEFAAICKGISRAWQSHWKRPPNPDAFAKLVQSAKVTTAYQKQSLLKSYRNRWRLAQNTLRNPAHSGSLTSTKKVAA